MNRIGITGLLLVISCGAAAAAADQAPVSGSVRDVGADGSHLMEPTSIEADLQTRCHQARQGLILLDRATLQRCGNAPTADPANSHDQGGHSGHGEMNDMEGMDMGEPAPAGHHH
ncbi:MAG: hypothetical protein HY940_04340 [Gammaproteobacteria bacterium]|nr:hypothetical protein [Gammaproteobacteria bacterium]